MTGRLIWSIPVPESDCQNRSPFIDTIFEYQANMIPEWKSKSDVAYLDKSIYITHHQ